MKTYEEQLDSVQAAIAAIEGGAQKYEMDGRTVERAELKTLYDREARLMRLVKRAQAGGGLRVRPAAMRG